MRLSEWYTPLMKAVVDPRVPLETVERLVAEGAKLEETSRVNYEVGRTVLSLALKAGDLRKIQLLVRLGANVRYQRPGGYDALIDAAYGADKSPELFRLLLAHGAPIGGVSSHGESALGTLSRFGRFESVRVLIESGTDAARLQWAPLHHAVALGTLEEVREAPQEQLEARDHQHRTPFLLAIHVGDVAKAELLLRRGANSRATGHMDLPPLTYARKPAMLRWLLAMGAEVDQPNSSGMTPLLEAAEEDDLEAVRLLLDGGANIEAECFGETALGKARSAAVLTLLLDRGADPRRLKHEGHRAILGLGEIDDAPLAGLTSSSARFGCSNPEKIDDPFWLGMVRAGVNAYLGRVACGPCAHPVWSAERFGQSLTRLPDGRMIQIGGEHEDSYDPDFWIYNDVIVHHPDRRIDIYGYPEDVFPPTDLHTATLVGNSIWVIGCLGHPGQHANGITPVFRLNLATFRMDRVDAHGDGPGWIEGHRARLVSAHEILITHGEGPKFVLDVERERWRRLP